MMRTIEIVLVIIIIFGALATSSFYAVLPQPRDVSPLNLGRIALTTLQTLDVDYDLSKTVFKLPSDPSWSQLQTALSASLPPHVVFNFTVYEVLNGEADLYRAVHSISNAESLGGSSDVSSYFAVSSNVTFNVVPEKIGEHGGGTLYILNCSDANGWWITGYTAQNLAEDSYKLLSPYFQTTIMIQNTTEFEEILDGRSLQGERVQDAVIINSFGETVPIPAGYYTSSGVGFDADAGSYARYCYSLGQKVQQYNWTWVSIVGYPLFYVSNTGYFTGAEDHNSYGVYGMKNVGPAGLNAFLQGLDIQTYSHQSDWITGSPGIVYLSSQGQYYCNYYGIYPSLYQTSTRALPDDITSTYNLRISTYVFEPKDNWIPGAVYRHTSHGGALCALGLTRSPDIRLTVLGLLADYKPRLLSAEYTSKGTSRLVTLQLGLSGGV